MFYLLLGYPVVFSSCVLLSFALRWKILISEETALQHFPQRHLFFWSSSSSFILWLIITLQGYYWMLNLLEHFHRFPLNIWIFLGCRVIFVHNFHPKYSNFNTVQHTDLHWITMKTNFEKCMHTISQPTKI